MKIFHLQDFGPDYARTLRLWRDVGGRGLLGNHDIYGLRARSGRCKRRRDTLQPLFDAEDADARSGHSYFRESPWVSSDILMTLLYDLDPPERGADGGLGELDPRLQLGALGVQLHPLLHLEEIQRLNLLFELPHLLIDEYPRVYDQLSAFYRQDPAA